VAVGKRRVLAALSPGKEPRCPLKIRLHGPVRRVLKAEPLVYTGV